MGMVRSLMMTGWCVPRAGNKFRFSHAQGITNESYAQSGRWDNGQDRVTFITSNSALLYYPLCQDNFDSPEKEHKEYSDLLETRHTWKCGDKVKMCRWMVTKMSMLGVSVVSSCTVVGWDGAGRCGVGMRNKSTHDNVTQALIILLIQYADNTWFILCFYIPFISLSFISS